MADAQNTASTPELWEQIRQSFAWIGYGPAKGTESARMMYVMADAEKALDSLRSRMERMEEVVEAGKDLLRAVGSGQRVIAAANDFQKALARLENVHA